MQNLKATKSHKYKAFKKMVSEQFNLPALDQYQLWLLANIFIQHIIRQEQYQNSLVQVLLNMETKSTE